MENSYVFEWFDQLIVIKLNPKKESLSSLTQAELTEFELQADAKKETIRLVLLQEVFNTDREKTIELRIEQYQLSIIRLLDQLSDYGFQPHRPICSLYKKLREVLEELLQFIETYFTRYFNLDQHIPPAYWATCKRGLQQDAKKGRTLLSELQEDPVLVSIVTNYFFNPGVLTTPWSYRKLAYHRAFMKELLEIHSYHPFEGEGITSLTAFLIYLNFNSAAFIQYAIADLEKRGQSAAESGKKIALLHRVHSTLKLMQVKPDAGFAPALPAAKDFLLQWISFELNYKPENTMNDMGSLPQSINEDKKVQVSVSVAMLGLFLRLLTEEDIITTRNQSDLIRFFAAHFATPKQSHISSDSLYGSYFKPQPGTVRMMKECLFRMQSTLNKQF